VDKTFEGRGITISPLNRPNISVANPGLDREVGKGTSPPVMALVQEWEAPWHGLVYWESEYQATQGLISLQRRPFLVLDQYATTGMVFWVPTRMLYPNAPTSTDQDYLKWATHYVTAAVQQAHEFARAAKQVSEMAQPPLLFYSAEMLARAVVAAVLGPDELKTQSNHGIEAVRQPSGELRGCIKWQRRGIFPALYRTVRWDVMYGHLATTGHRRPQFHVLECLRRLEIVQWPDSVRWNDHQVWAHHKRLLRAWDDQRPDDYYLKSAVVNQESLFDVPDVIVEFTVLYYLGMLARYHPARWRDLLAGRSPEGFYLRQAAETLFPRFIRHIADLLPTQSPAEKTFYPTAWVEQLPSFEDLQPDLQGLRAHGSALEIAKYPAPDEWQPPQE
jgi:hypothetical protein